MTEQEALLIVTSRMREILKVDLLNQTITVQPGVVNSWVTRRSREMASITPRIRPVRWCAVSAAMSRTRWGALPEIWGDQQPCFGHGSGVARWQCHDLGSDLVESPDLDLRGAFIGSEGTLGIATAITLRLLRAPEKVSVLLADFPTMEAAGDAVRRVTAAGVLPAGMEIMDNFMINAVNDLFGRDEYPRDAAAVLLIEFDARRRKWLWPPIVLLTFVLRLARVLCVERMKQRIARCCGKDASPRLLRSVRSHRPITSRPECAAQQPFPSACSDRGAQSGPWLARGQCVPRW